MSEARIPLRGGERKLISECSVAELEGFKRWAKDRPSNPRYAAQDTKTLEAVNLMIEHLLENPGDAPQARRAAPPRVERKRDEPKAAEIVRVELPAPRVLSSAEEATRVLNDAARTCHLITPVTYIGAIPDGFGIALNYRKIEPVKPHVFELRENSTNVGLSATTLFALAGDMDLRWVAAQSGRLDDGKTPNYAHYMAVAYVESFDGSPRFVFGSVELDLREGSAQLAALKARTGKDKKVDATVRDRRFFLHRIAETAARTRAIAAAGVRRNYDVSEFNRPFAAARLVFTGQSADPELRRELTRMRAQARLQGSSVLYGDPRTARSLPPHVAQLMPDEAKELLAERGSHGHAAPKSPSQRVEEDLSYFDGLYDVHGEEVKAS